MNLYTFLSFFYGAVGGAVSCFFFFFIAFRKIESTLANTVRKKARKHAEFDAVAKEAAVVTPAKVETLCKMVRFDDGIVSEAIQCRMVLYSDTIDIYQVDELRTLPDHRQEVVKEHMLGRINRRCIEATGERISKYHRHRNKSTRYAAIKGKCTIVRHKDGVPLFLEDPAALLKERLSALRREQRQHIVIDRVRRRAQRDGITLTDEEALAKIHEAEAAASKGTFLDHLAMATGVVSRCEGSLRLGGGAGRCVSYSGGGHRSSPRSSSSFSPVEDVPLSQWTCLAIKFPTRRVQERWLNLLQSTTLSTQWRDFIQHLPKMDVFNLLVARLFFENSRANTLHDLLEEKLKKKLERVSKSLPQRLHGNIYLDALDVGGEIPLISNVSDPTPSTCGDTEFDFDVLYRGGFALKIRFAVWYREIRVPDIIFSIKVLELAGRMRFVVGPPPTKKFWLGCPRPPQLRLDFTQEVASHDGILNAVLKLLPDMSQIASNVVTSLFFEDMVFPNLDDFPWPVLGQEDEDSEAEHDGSAADKTHSDIGEHVAVHDDSLSTFRSDEIVVGGPHQLPGYRPEDHPAHSQAAPSFAVSITPLGEHDSQHRSDKSGERASSHEPRRHTSNMPSPPPRPPSSRATPRTSGVAVPMRRDSSAESMTAGGSLERSQPPAHTSNRLHSCGGSSASLGTLPPGLPPRPPRAATMGVAREIKVPTSRAPGSASYRSRQLSDFKEPEEEEEE
jgi:hypothetical protein